MSSSDAAVFLLDSLLEKERLFLADQNAAPISEEWDAIGTVEREAAVRWLVEAGRRGPVDTVCLATALLDQILTHTRVQAKYLHCVSLAAFYLASKLTEEPEAVPSVGDVCRLGGARYSHRELLRMERVILSRLRWNLSYPTLDKFLQLMLVISLPGKELTGELRRGVESVLATRSLSDRHAPRASLLALALLSLHLEARRHPLWLAITWNLQRLIKADPDELIRCREKVSAQLGQQMRVAEPEEEKENRTTRSPRKRLRPRSHGSDSELGTRRRLKTPPLDDIADSLHLLYDHQQLLVGIDT